MFALIFFASAQSFALDCGAIVRRLLWLPVNGVVAHQRQEFRDPSAKGFFAPSYAAARDSFRQLGQQIVTQEAGHAEMGSIKVNSEVDQDLTVDWLYIGAKGEPKNVVVITSGIHGSEGYAGSAFQQVFLKEVFPNLPAEVLDNTGFLIVHAANPFGMKYFRRVTERNVDLNRNWLRDASDFGMIKNEEYERLKNFFYSRRFPATGVWSATNSHDLLSRLISRMGISFVDEAFSSGQYHDPKGTMYGGSAYEPQVVDLTDLFDQKLAAYQRVLLMDVHTGLGDRETLHLLSNKIPDRLKDVYQRIFNGFHLTDVSTDENFYVTTGDFTDFLPQRYPDKLVIALTFEYGTLGNDLMSRILAMMTMKQENLGVQNGCASEDARANIHQAFINQFNPTDPGWRESVIDKARGAIFPIINRFSVEVLK